MTMLKETLKQAARDGKARNEPLWQGPESDGPNGGITQSMLANWLVCRERFRIKYVVGLQPRQQFNHRTGYGDMWHVCEESHARDDGRWAIDLTEHCKELCRRYPLQQEEVNKWYQVCKVQFPLYVAHWAKHPDVLARTPLLQEQTFDVPYRLPSGRTVRLRGKLDAVDLIGKGWGAGIYLQENKTKGDVDEQRIRTQMTFDLQTMLYLVALKDWQWQQTRPILGVRYNVIRRPLSGGKGSIVQHKATKNKRAETDAEYWKRLSGIIADSPDDFFLRLKVEVSAADIVLFRRTCLDPILENVTDDAEWWTYCKTQAHKDRTNPEFDGEHRRYRFPHHHSRHFRMPYGVYSPLVDGGGTEYDEYLSSGSTVGLEQVDRLFKECT